MKPMIIDVRNNGDDPYCYVAATTLFTSMDELIRAVNAQLEITLDQMVSIHQSAESAIAAVVLVDTVTVPLKNERGVLFKNLLDSARALKAQANYLTDVKKAFMSSVDSMNDKGQKCVFQVTLKQAKEYGL